MFRFLKAVAWSVAAFIAWWLLLLATPPHPNVVLGVCMLPFAVIGWMASGKSDVQ